MPGMREDGDNGVEIEQIARFDETWETYDEADLAMIRQDGSKIGEFREDADGILFARQLDYVKARTYNRKYPELSGSFMVPDATDTPEYANTITVRTYDEVGVAKIISNYADDLPRADVRAIESSVRVRTIGDSFGYNVSEIRASRALGTGLDTRKAAAARRAIEQKLNRVKFVGDDDYGMLGLFNHPNVPIVVAINGNWNGAATTGSMILEDLNAMYSAIADQSNGVHMPNTLGLPSRQYASATTKPVDGMPGQTAMSFFRAQHPEVTVRIVYETKGAGAGATDIAFMYERNNENLEHELVMPFNQMPPQERNLEFVVPCMARSGGVQIYYPLAFAKMEDI